MYYINPTPNESGNHGNPMGQPFPGSVSLPDDLLTAYLDCNGFAILAIEDNTVTAVEPNRTALDEYNATHPDTPPEPEPEEEYLSVSELAAALKEGVNDV